MANDFFYFTGVAEWAKVQKPDEKYQVYTVDVYLDQQSLKLFKDSGLQLELRDDPKDATKGPFVKFRRPVTKKVREELIKMGPPTVLLEQDGEYIPFTDNIGNGSEVTVKVRVYDTMKGKGHELDTIAVTSLVEYKSGESFTPDGTELPF